MTYLAEASISHYEHPFIKDEAKFIYFENELSHQSNQSGSNK